MIFVDKKIHTKENTQSRILTNTQYSRDIQTNKYSTQTKTGFINMQFLRSFSVCSACNR